MVTSKQLEVEQGGKSKQTRTIKLISRGWKIKQGSRMEAKMGN